MFENNQLLAFFSLRIILLRIPVIGKFFVWFTSNSFTVVYFDRNKWLPQFYSFKLPDEVRPSDFLNRMLHAYLNPNTPFMGLFGDSLRYSRKGYWIQPRIIDRDIDREVTASNFILNARYFHSNLTK